MKKRTIAILLVFFLIFGLIPNSVLSVQKCSTPESYIKDMENLRAKSKDLTEDQIKSIASSINTFLIYVENQKNNLGKPAYSLERRFYYQTKAIDLFFQFYFKSVFDTFDDETFSIIKYLRPYRYNFFGEEYKNMIINSKNKLKETPGSLFEIQKEQLRIGAEELKKNIDEETTQEIVYTMMLIVDNIFTRDYFQDKKTDFEEVKSVIQYLPFIGDTELNELQQKDEINIEDIISYYENYEEQLGTLLLDQEELEEAGIKSQVEMISEVSVTEPEISMFDDFTLVYFGELMDQKTPFETIDIDNQKEDFENYEELFDELQLEFEFKRIQDKIKEYNIILENTDLNQAEKEELKNLVRSEFLLGKYLYLTGQETDNKYFNELKNQYVNFQTSLNNYNSQIDFFKNMKESEILDKMIDLEIEKRIQVRDLKKKGIDLVYKPFMDFFNGDSIREVEIEGKPMVMLFDFEGHGMIATLHQLVVDSILNQLEENLRTTRETFGKTNQQILDIYTSQLNNLVKEKGKIIKIPGTIFYGDNMVISGDTAAYLKGDAEYPIKFYKPKNVVFGVVKGIHYPSLDLENVEFASTDGLIESEMDNNYNLNLANAILNKEHFIKELDVLTEFDGTTWEIESETDFNKFKPNQEKRTFVVNDDITLIKVDDVFKNYLKGEFLEAVPFEYSTENIFLEDLPQYFEGKVFDVVETAVYEQKISGLMSEVNKLIGEIRQSSSMQDKQQLERLMGNFLAVIKQIQEETTDSGTFRNDLREEAVEVTLKKLNGLDYNSKLNIVNAVEEYNKQNVFNEVNVDIIKQFLEVQNVDELIARLKDATIC